eukprot:gnl/MRDRNA2_/MRDRNA2_186016_c0_seq1.p1 gnl/MRDRNA2_/MRDRNA2_186016_c0~~gnl/MRDRNA2_/MRDRNA2_186016_c0_seq1.p1  ORF type:complete len:182 (+),score=11.89 gnl/MRDRNA2_/MRDRNA2_186016_c0_seq1:69-548(+)
MHDVKDYKRLRGYVLSVEVRERLGLLKMDCDGCEPYALKGAVCLACRYGIDNIFTEYYPRQIERRSGSVPQDFLVMLRDLGFRCTPDYHSDKLFWDPSRGDPLDDPTAFTQELVCAPEGSARSRVLFNTKKCPWRPKLDLDCQKKLPVNMQLCANYQCG